MAINFEDFLTVDQKINTGGGQSFFTITAIEENNIEIKLKTGTAYTLLKKKIINRINNNKWENLNNLDPYEIGIAKYILKKIEQKTTDIKMSEKINKQELLDIYLTYQKKYDKDFLFYITEDKQNRKQKPFWFKNEYSNSDNLNGNIFKNNKYKLELNIGEGHSYSSVHIRLELKGKINKSSSNYLFFIGLLSKIKFLYADNEFCLIDEFKYDSEDFHSDFHFIKGDFSWENIVKCFLLNIIPEVKILAKKYNIKIEELFLSQKEFTKQLEEVNIFRARKKYIAITDIDFNCPSIGEKTFEKNQEYQKNTNIVNKQFKPINGIPLNQILYGPPGTGKTYSTVEYALKILGAEDRKDEIKSIGQLKEAFGSQVEFVTFHQSFSYEDFVEGLKANSDDGEINYSIENGVFKEICENASSKTEITNTNTVINDKTIWKMSLGEKNNTAEQYFNEASETNSLVLGWGSLIDFSKCNTREDVIETLHKSASVGEISAVNMFKNTMRVGDIVIISDGNYKFKAIAEITGGYYFDKESDLPQKRKIKWLQKFSNSLPVLDISRKNFTQTTINQPQYINKEILQTYLTESQKIENQKPHVLIIDEINRGNISRIFGELITLIEPSKRAGNDEEISVQLPYSKKELFSVPNNLYIIGTMNTADRSLALMDTALRRRFNFTEMMPDVDLVNGHFNEIYVGKILASINQRIEVLYDREHTIGHAFLMNVDTLPKLISAFKNKILPLLEEYFYDDWEKICLVLNDENAFYKKEEKELGNIKKTIYQKQDIDELEPKVFIKIYTETNAE